jgi:hypothetical protein
MPLILSVVAAIQVTGGEPAAGFDDQQCGDTMSGIGGFCTNQFYNPKPAARARKRQVY